MPSTRINPHWREPCTKVSLPAATMFGTCLSKFNAQSRAILNARQHGADKSQERGEIDAMFASDSHKIATKTA